MMRSSTRVDRAPAAMETLRQLSVFDDYMIELHHRVRAEYLEMPGLRLTLAQAARLFGVTAEIASAVLEQLCHASILVHSPSGTYSLVHPTVGHDLRPRPNTGESRMNDLSDQSLTAASDERLASLLRHWTWADEARTRFEQELDHGWEYDEPLIADHPFGSFCHWCALLCGLGEAAIERGLLPVDQLELMRRDLEASLPDMRACRQILLAIPSSTAPPPDLAGAVRDEAVLGQLRRVHEALGAALRRERLTREIDSLDH